MQDHARSRHGVGNGSGSGGGGRKQVQARMAPGRRTLTAGLAAAAATSAPMTAPMASAGAPPADSDSADPQIGQWMDDAVRPDLADGVRAATPHEAASYGVADAGGAMPHASAIQAAFGHHDVSAIAAHVGGAAATASENLGAEAYATGNHVAFREAPDLHTAAHEAAHVVQQRAGVHLEGGLGEVGDAHERGADAVADRVVRGESAAPLLDTMIDASSGTSSSATPVIQQRKGDFASFGKRNRPSKLLVRYQGEVFEATVTTNEETATLTRQEGEPLVLPKDTVESDGFELLDGAVARDPAAEERITTNKKKGLVEVFAELVKSSGVTIAEEHIVVLQQAHDAKQPAAKFALCQRDYQKMLMSTFTLSLGQIMNFHRSAGYEYEFGRFYDTERLHIEQEPELLRSHVTLALSQGFSGLFEGRADAFRLETDSRNCLELVTPPFLSLICGETVDVLQLIHTLISETTLELGREMQTAVDVPICKQLALFGKLVCPTEWKWEAEDEATQRFCFAFKGAKHGSKAYGQANISMTPEEIIATATVLPEWNKEQAQLGFSSMQTKIDSVPTALSNLITAEIASAVTAKEQLKGVVTLYARATSNLVGIPSILYRRLVGERPEEGNLATEIKETLLIWVKDFPHTIIADFLCGTELGPDFCGALLGTTQNVWGLIKPMLDQNLLVLGAEVEKKLVASTQVGSIAAFLKALQERDGQLSGGDRLDIMNEFKRREHPTQTALIDAFALAKQQALQQAQDEYQRMVALHVATLQGQPYVKRHTKSEDAEEFGDGYGVRKDTYLDRAPGDRRLRVAEIRDTAHLARLQGTL